MKKLLAVLSLGLLVGCAGTIQDRLDGGVKASVTTDKTPQEYVDCLKETWIQFGSPNVFKIERGFRLVPLINNHVEVMAEITTQNGETLVELFYRWNMTYRHNKTVQELENCT